MTANQINTLINQLQCVGDDYDFHENALIFKAIEALKYQQARIAKQQQMLECSVTLDDYNDLLVVNDKMTSALEKLARLGNGDRYGNSDGNVIAQQALMKGYK